MSRKNRKAVQRPLAHIGNRVSYWDCGSGENGTIIAMTADYCIIRPDITSPNGYQDDYLAARRWDDVEVKNPAPHPDEVSKTVRERK